MFFYRLLCSLILLAALPSQAAPVVCHEGAPGDFSCKADEVLTNVNCDAIQNLRCAKKFSKAEQTDFIIGSIVDSFINVELDPSLGEGSLISIANASGKGSTVIYENFTETPYSQTLFDLSSAGVLIGIRKSHLSKIGKDQKQSIQQLISRGRLKVEKNPVQIFEF